MRISGGLWPRSTNKNRKRQGRWTEADMVRQFWKFCADCFIFSVNRKQGYQARKQRKYQKF